LRILLRNDKKSRHRRIKKLRRYERLAATSQFFFTKLLQTFPNEVIVSLGSQYCTYKNIFFLREKKYFPSAQKASKGTISSGNSMYLTFAVIFIFFIKGKKKKKTANAHLTMRYDAHCKMLPFYESPRNCPLNKKKGFLPFQVCCNNFGVPKISLFEKKFLSTRDFWLIALFFPIDFTFSRKRKSKEKSQFFRLIPVVTFLTPLAL
jgi:hypothetical protein